MATSKIKKLDLDTTSDVCVGNYNYTTQANFNVTTTKYGKVVLLNGWFENTVRVPIYQDAFWVKPPFTPTKNISFLTSDGYFIYLAKDTRGAGVNVEIPIGKHYISCVYLTD